MRYSNDLSFAKDMDAADPLATFRSEFHFPISEGRKSTYLCGNSLGLMPKRTVSLLQEELQDWAKLGVEGHFAGVRPWVNYHENLTHSTARLVGATPEEVVCMNSLTVNLHLMLVSFYRPTQERFKILIEKPAFPSDRYALESQIRCHGLDPQETLLELGPRDGESIIRQEDIDQTLELHGPAIALVLFPGVQYYSGQVFDMAALCDKARSKGCAVGLDLAHAVGNIPLQLHDWGCDFAVWCSYKYLNAGPGAVGGCFVHQRHHTAELNRFAGWWGHNKETRFQMGPNFDPIAGAEGWQLSNSSVLSMTPLIASMELFEQADLHRLRSKSIVLTGYLEFLLRDSLSDAIEILTPMDPAQRGCQLSVCLLNGKGKDVFNALQKAHVICDWREPNVIRLSPAPIYNSFADVHTAVTTLKQILGK